jgi:hypothetical protein
LKEILTKLYFSYSLKPQIPGRLTRYERSIWSCTLNPNVWYEVNYTLILKYSLILTQVYHIIVPILVSRSHSIFMMFYSPLQILYSYGPILSMIPWDKGNCFSLAIQNDWYLTIFDPTLAVFHGLILWNYSHLTDW